MHSASRSRGVYVRSTLLLLCRKEGDRNNVIDRQTLQVGVVQLYCRRLKLKVVVKSNFHLTFTLLLPDRPALQPVSLC
jgi:hypothetical protein